MMEEITEAPLPHSQPSVVNRKLYFHENQWVVSVLNTKKKEFAGHAVILVEGIRNGQLFVGRYDIFAATDESNETSPGQSSFFSVINKKGYIANIRMEESSSYDRIACRLVLLCKPTEGIPADISKNEIILQKVANHVTAYWLDGSYLRQKSLPEDTIEQQMKLKFPTLEAGRHLIQPNDNVAVIQKITALCGYKHPDGATFYAQCPSKSFTLSTTAVEKMIQSIQADKLRTENARVGKDTYIRYQYLGSENAHGLLNLFSQSGCGINCAEWCLEKLKVAGIQLEVKPTPTQVTGGICLLL